MGNDTNLIVKVKPDRACSQWLACSSGETVYDPQEGKYKSICTDLQLCNKAGEPEGAGIPYCSNYVARDPLSGEMLRKNVVLNAATYATRPTGFGKPDYGGITIPDQFQLLDAELVPIGSIISSDPRVKSRYKKDYRLAVPVPYVHDETNTNVGTARKPTQDEKDALSGATGLKDRACVFVQNGSYGILEDTNGSGTFNTGDTCWLSMDQGQPPSLAGAGAPITADNLNVPNLATRFQQDTQPILDQVLSRSFPNTQCKAAPQGDAPFGNEFVIEWDDTVTPPKPKRLASGYASVNLCEYGEDCACTYKRVAYGGKSRFYGPLSTNVLNAMCVGGAKDGLPCVLDVGIKSSTAPEGTLKDDAGNEIKASDLVPKDKFTGIPPEQACGEGGTCQPISGVSLVRGVTGQCLQYDLARVVAGDQTRSECLVWSPTPVLAGPGDLYHWSPTAGWKPPISSGRYYCASPVQKPKTFQLKPRTETVSPLTAKPLTLVEGFGFRANKKGTYAGQISTFTYSDGIASDKSCLDFPNPFGDDCDGNGSGGSLDGHNSEGTDMGRWCEEADDDQSPSSDLSAVRLVTTGAGGSRSYAEYAVLLDTLDPESKGNIGRAISGSTDKDIIFENTLEDTIANFSFSTDHGKLGCEYSEDFGSVGGMDYDDRDSWYPQDKKWQANFKAEMAKSGNKLDRKNASIVTEDGSPSGIPVKVKCENPVNGETCFLKTWQLDYKAEGEDRFQAFSPDVGRLGMNALSESPVYGKCNSDHSWFSIRAVFEDSDPTENDKDAEEVTPEALAGPFQLIGFWVTTCSPHSGPRYIYMYVHMGTADVCRELAETISKDSHEATAFTDRNSERSGFAIPKSGFTWGTTNVPFGASLATRDAGKEPLYMDGVKQAASNPIHPPVFTFPGQTYFRAEKYPSSNWGMLSNVFARIYRIYGYYVRGVNRDSWACTNKQSPNFGQWCPNLDDVEDGSEKDKLAQKYCGLEAKCVSGGISGTNVFEQKACNSFSGVNRGLDCSIDPDICHKGPMELDEIDGILRPQYSSCNVYQGEKVTWEQSPTKKYWRCSGSKSDGCPDECNKTKKDLGCTRSEAMRNGAFRCSDSSVRGPSKILASADNAIRGSFCTKPADVSAECPMELQNEACIKNSASDAIGTCQSHPWAECNLDADCHFYARNFWPSGSENTTFVWSTGEQKNAGNWMESFKRGTSPASAYYGWPHNFATNHAGFKQNCSSDTDCPFKTAFPQEGIFEHAGGGGVPFFFHPIAAISSYGGVVYAQSYVPNNEYVTGYNKVAFAWDDRSLLKLYPGFSPMVVFKRNGIWCSANFGTDSESCDNSSGTIVGNAVEWIDQPASAAPYGYFQFLSKPYTPAGNGITYLSKNDAKGRLQIHYGACEPLALMAREGTTSTRPSGTCRGGARSGAVCQTDVECRPTGMKPADYDTLQADSINWCNPVTSGLVGGYSKGTENADCWPGDFASNLSNPNHPKKQEDPELDSNICTHPPGYWPRPNYCLDPNDEYCGLFGYDLNTAKLAGSVNDGKPLPTDVTPGLYTPAFLNPGGKTATPKTVGNSLDYNYVEFYNPAPPQVAAPDMRTCTGGQCRVSGLGTIGMDGLNEGVVNGGAGGHVATLRFYAWASHDQMPLRRVVVDWGDGNRTELPDAFMKNRKPYCQTEKECTEAPGLTCESDADCPPGAGTCETYGTCAARPSVKCYKDAQCEFGGEDGTCNPRTYFGNDQDACDEQYFEFRHAYACLPGTMAGLTSCGTTGHCSGDLNRTCTTAANCADGDRCVSNMAPINGCKDAVSNTCRFTPRVLITDNWGWCSGECRGLLNQSGVLVDVSGSPIRHPNGGCFDASRIRSNADFVTSVGPNECDVSNPKGAANSSVEKRYRPWIVFPGSIQLLTGETQ
ncbi:MAG TPA: hypothetical protein VN397_02150 [Candidatus Methylomirabilis sp.]|nr:hypothetical protein [Candidatus Methylomirabilis sp.]